MVMRWFTREWATSVLDNDESERRAADYQQHVEAIRPHLQGGAEQLSYLDLHDAQVRSCDLTDHDALRLHVLVGDLQRGYEWVSLRYDEAQLVGATIDDIRGWRITEPGVELLYDEIDVADNGRYEHRILVWPDGEFGIRFKSLRLTRDPAPPSDRR